MSEGDYQIVLDAEVGERLERMAAARGVSARDLVSALVDEAPVAGDSALLDELEQLWALVEAGSEPLVVNDDVRSWLSTWGTSEFKPWPSSRR